MTHPKNVDKGENRQCPNHHKDFCQCMRELDTEYKLQNIEKSIDRLEKAGIPFKETNTQNLIEIELKDDEKIIVSLKTKGYMVKYRYAGKKKWYTSYISKFIKMVSENKK